MTRQRLIEVLRNAQTLHMSCVDSDGDDGLREAVEWLEDEANAEDNLGKWSDQVGWVLWLKEPWGKR